MIHYFIDSKPWPCGMEVHIGATSSADIDKVDCVHCLRALLTKDNAIENTPKIKLCDDCAFLSLTEQEQTTVYKETGRRPEHTCNRFDVQLFHPVFSNVRSSVLLRTDGCIRLRGFLSKQAVSAERKALLAGLPDDNEHF